MISLLKNIQNFNFLMAVQVHEDYFVLAQIEMDMNTSSMKTLVIDVYNKYGALLFEDAVKLKWSVEIKMKPFE